MNERSAHPARVVISNGFDKMHLTIAAREASDRGMLELAITGAYPTQRARALMRGLRADRAGRLGRLMQRDEGIPPDRLRAIALPELASEIADAVGRVPHGRELGARLTVATWRLYGRAAARTLPGPGRAGVFHYRAGFGGASVARARRLGMVALCDHALAHPAVLESLVEERGRLPEPPSDGPAAPPADPVLRAVQRDIEAADAIVVNSDFVRETFVAAGWRGGAIHVAYLGVDDNFLAEEPRTVPPRRAPHGPLPLLFASRFERRKGAESVLEALAALDRRIDWDLVIAGPVSPDIEASHRVALADERVHVLGPLSRRDFKRQLIERAVFVFPSYAEGSARAVFDAMACGCYVITTPNAGSIVEHGVHGALVPPGDSGALVDAILEADRDRERVARIGAANAALIESSYRQHSYGEALARLYGQLAQAGARTP